MLAKVFIQWVNRDFWIPAFAGMTIVALPDKNREIQEENKLDYTLMFEKDEKLQLG